MTKFYAVAKRPSIGRGKLYRLRDGYYTYEKSNPGIEATSSKREADGAAANLTAITGKRHFAAFVCITVG